MINTKAKSKLGMKLQWVDDEVDDDEVHFFESEN